MTSRILTMVAAATTMAACQRRDVGVTDPSPVKSVSVTVATSQLIVGGTTRATAVLRDGAGNVIADRGVTWTSLTPSIVSVNDLGDVTGLQTGTGQVRAASGSVSGTQTIVVRNAFASTVRLARDTATIGVPGGSVQAIASVADETGRSIVNPAITWASSNALVAAVNVSGLITSVASGTAVITATVDGISASMTVTVRPVANAQAPVIATVTPTVLRPGAAYVVTGTGFGATPGANQVLVDGMLAQVLSANPTQLSIVLPVAGFTCEPSHDAYLQITSTAAPGAPGAVALPLQVGARRAFVPGQSVVVTDAAEVRCNELVPGDGRWVVSIYNATRAPVTPATPAGIQFSIRGLTTAAALAKTSSAAALTAAPVLPPTPDPRDVAHADLLERNIDALRATPRVAAARAAGAAATGARAQVTTVGAITNVKLPNLDAGDFCVSSLPVGGRTVFAGPHAVILEDTISTLNGRATLKGQMDSYLIRLGQEFEAIMWPILNASFGNPLAMDAQLGGPGRVVMVFSPRVNAMQRGGVVGYVANCDLFPASQRPSSNAGAFFYAVVPTSLAAGYANSETRDQWLRIMRSTVIHEVRHITSFAERTARGLPLEDASWEEGGARIAEEMFARSSYATLPRANTSYAASVGCDIQYLVATSPCANRPVLMLRHFDGLYSYLATPEVYSPLGRTFSGEVAFYAGAWSFLRWASDHFGQLESQFFRDFTTASSTGAANLEARTGRQWEEMLGEWSSALYLDDAPGVAMINQRLKFPSWNLVDIWAGLCNDLGPCRDFSNPVQIYSRPSPFLPKQHGFGNFLLGVGTMAGGGFTILDLSDGVPAASQVVELRSLIGTNDPPPTLRLAITRVR